MIRLAFLPVGLAAPATAVDLRVFARVDGDVVIVETMFSSGRVPISGEIALSDAEGAAIGTVALDDDGETAFALPDAVRETGTRIDVTVSEGHSEYWLLTPGDSDADRRNDTSTFDHRRRACGGRVGRCGCRQRAGSARGGAGELSAGLLCGTARR